MTRAWIADAALTFVPFAAVVVVPGACLLWST